MAAVRTGKEKECSMNDLTDKLQKMHEEWQQSYTLAMAATQDEQKAKCIAADKYSVQLMEMIPEIVQRVHEPGAEKDGEY